jgi:hypothetical protein
MTRAKGELQLKRKKKLVKWVKTLALERHLLFNSPNPLYLVLAKYPCKEF